MAGPSTQIPSQPFWGFLSHSWPTWAVLSDALCKYLGPDWQVSHGTKRPSKWSCLWWEKSHRGTGRAFNSCLGKGNRTPLPPGVMSPGCQCRLNRRKWQVGYWESGRWGPGTKNNLCLCFLCMAVSFVTLVLKLSC